MVLMRVFVKFLHIKKNMKWLVDVVRYATHRVINRKKNIGINIPNSMRNLKMIWNLKIGDIIELSGDVYHYEVTDVYKNWAVLKNQLTLEVKEIKISRMKDMIKVIRRKD
jgi:hypothetical protein